MKVLVDECIDWRLLRDLVGVDAKTVKQMGWSETVNGALLRLAEKTFDVFLTVDRNLSYPQNIASPRHRDCCPARSYESLAGSPTAHSGVAAHSPETVTG